MIVSLVLAVSENGVIGKNNQLPWRLPADMKLFRETTTGHTVIMGRKTWESLGRPLKNRRNVIVSSNTELVVDGGEVYHSLGDALKSCVGEEEVFIIGGGMIYKKALELDIVSRIYYTLVHGEFDGDSFFDLPGGKDWETISERHYEADTDNEYAFTYFVKERTATVPDIFS